MIRERIIAWFLSPPRQGRPRVPALCIFRRAAFAAVVMPAGLAMAGPDASPPSASPPFASPQATLAVQLVAFSDLDGWAADDHAAALAVHAANCARTREVWAGRHSAEAPAVAGTRRDAGLWSRACEAAGRVPAQDGEAARRFFEETYVALRIGAPGFVTGYYEPEIEGSLTRDARFTVPLLAAPADLEKLPADAAARRALGVDPALEFARRTPSGYEEFPDREAIARGALAGQGLEIVWLENAVEAFFVHIQGSARIRLRDGSSLRVSYAAKSGHPYTAIGRLLIERGEIAREDMSMDRLRAWLAAHPGQAQRLMDANRSYIFFTPTEARPAEGPVGAAGVPLTAGRSLAVDETLVPFGTPLFVSAPALPLGPDGAAEPFARLMLAEDRGSAIRGPARGDLFLGSGATAGGIAGRIRHAATFTLLVPRGASLAETAR